MTHFVTYNNVSVVTAILPQYIAKSAIEEVFSFGDRNALLINARGTLMRDRWYQALLPMMSPEKEFLQFLVPDTEVDAMMECLVAAAELHLPGSGAVFAVPCDELRCTEDFPVWSTSTWENDSFDASHNLKENLTAIFCIVQKDRTDRISRAAMSAGAHGPVVFYCEGRGLRDRLGWLRITKKNDMEVLVLIVDNADADAVTEAMVDAGDIDLPVRGFLYRMPVQKGVINVGSSFGGRKYAANIQQIISAIDELKGSRSWRDQRITELVGTGKSAGLNLFGKIKERTYLTDQESLTCIVGRKHIDAIVNAALQGGAPGMNISFARLVEAESRETARGIRFNRERGIVRIILPEHLRTPVALRIQSACAEHDIEEVCIYSQPVTRGVTYIADPSTRSDTVAGGHPPAYRKR